VQRNRVVPPPQALTTWIWSRRVTALARKKISTTVYITPEQDARLKALHQRTKVPVAEYIRQGIDLVLDQYRDQLPGQVDLRLGSR
jgi:hypothetical protein